MSLSVSIESLPERLADSWSLCSRCVALAD